MPFICPKCGDRLWLAPPCAREEGQYFCNNKTCDFNLLQSEFHKLVKQKKVMWVDRWHNDNPSA